MSSPETLGPVKHAHPVLLHWPRLRMGKTASVVAGAVQLIAHICLHEISAVGRNPEHSIEFQDTHINLC